MFTELGEVKVIAEQVSPPGAMRIWVWAVVEIVDGVPVLMAYANKREEAEAYRARLVGSFGNEPAEKRK